MPKGTSIGGWRKLAAAAWGHPSDSQVYGDLDIDAGDVLSFLAEARAATGVPVTVTHVVGKALARALAEHPDLNVRLYRGRFYQRDTVDIFFIVSASSGPSRRGSR